MATIENLEKADEMLEGADCGTMLKTSRTSLRDARHLVRLTIDQLWEEQEQTAKAKQAAIKLLTHLRAMVTLQTGLYKNFGKFMGTHDSLLPDQERNAITKVIAMLEGRAEE